MHQCYEWKFLYVTTHSVLELFKANFITDILGFETACSGLKVYGLSALSQVGLFLLI